MLLFLVLTFVVAPIIEIFVFIQVGDRLGYGLAVLLLLAISVAGLWLVKRQGTGVLRRARAQLSAGQVPAAELVDGVLLLLAGVLLLVPGFVSAVVGLLLLVPVVRVLPNRLVRRRAAVRVATRAGTLGGTVVVRSRERRRGDEQPPRPPELGQ